MASKPIQCEMCCNENAVGHCKTCGHVGETCLHVHKTVKVFQTHMVSKNDENNKNPKVIKQDITEWRCKQHPTERAIFLCKIHDSIICGRCFHSGHLPCGKEIVDLLHEAASLDCEKVNKMKSALMAVKDEILLMKYEAEHSKNSSKNNAEKCVQECMELGNRIKQRVDELTSDIIHGITKAHDINVSIHSSIAQTCKEKIEWCDHEARKIDDFVDNNMAGHLYLMHRHFEKEVSEAGFHLKEIKRKHTFKGFDFKENKVILKCLFEDLEEVCEHQEEVTGSDDGNSDDVFISPSKINKTRRELTALLNQIKQDLDQSEKARKALCDELKQVKQDRDNSEKTRNELCDELKQVKKDKDNSEKERKILEQEVQKAKQDIEELKKARNAFCDELKQVKQDNDNSEKKRKVLEQELLKAKQGLEESEKKRKILEQELLKAKQDLEESEKERAIIQRKFPHINFNWTQPTGRVQVNASTETRRFSTYDVIVLVFTFPDGIQTTHYPAPGKVYKGGTFTGHLRSNPEGELLCRMLKAAFRRGLMFNLGKEGKVVLDDISLCNGPVFYGDFGYYAKYIRTLKAELAAKGITEAIIDQTEKLEGTFAVDGLSLLEAARSS